MIPVTKPFLPKQADFKSYVSSIWARQWLTNNGPLVNELELKLQQYLGLPHLLYVTNGTIALQLAIQALEVKGEIITTPFSFVATTSSIVWQGCKPVFVDIDENTLNIDPNKIEAAITSNTSAILATHVFGNPCDIEAIDRIAKKHRLKVIYDAAHCFGTKYKGKSIFAYGDVSTTSFHATKLFHTIEGGAVFTQNPEILKRMALMRNFGYSGVDTFSEIGINAKNSEFHAAMGLCNLKHIDQILSKRKELSLHYEMRLNKIEAQFQVIQADTEFNYAYYPVIFKSEEVMLDCMKQLELVQVYCRRYFYPSLSALPYIIKVNMPICDSISKRIMCLPLYHTLTSADQDLVARIILRTQNYRKKQVLKLADYDTLVNGRIGMAVNGH
ncbi:MULTISPECIES: DegT/DnrJ/EryC1/StrS family aminotransferase [unclassified Pedobacter]|uniref:DegT/DnrJ/EryC1/StrS family aminotransferase n=1 Tax=unclassified Pedobacter TaxID=2628915 RepID=UPI00142484B4|nr:MULTISPECIES: DegT/DnrJ/EryC1/StrS family aminotransferase [unclassified Pedobacter]NII82537.1 dTDP-4-amino-4,6-dideoxygalactose transaminase [Pedobacter sp. SG908]NMN36562.1 dTDP-4-amino-4,6-dideoxygalactose transaminase [Pedobacter sp. SG918]